MRHHLAQLADDAVWRNHRLLRAQAVVGALVDPKHVRVIRAAGADHLRGHGRRYILLLESQHALQTPALGGVLGEAGLLLAQTRDLLPQLRVLLARVAKIHIVGPQTPRTRPRRLCRTFHRAQDCHGPGPQKADLAAIFRPGQGNTGHSSAGRGRPVHLHCQPKRLRQYQRQQDQRVSQSSKGPHEDRVQNAAFRHLPSVFPPFPALLSVPCPLWLSRSRRRSSSSRR